MPCKHARLAATDPDAGISAELLSDRRVAVPLHLFLVDGQNRTVISDRDDVALHHLLRDVGTGERNELIVCIISLSLFAGSRARSAMADPRASAPTVTPSINRFMRTNYACPNLRSMSHSAEIERSAPRCCPTMARPQVYSRIADATLRRLDSLRCARVAQP